ncbi:hypothetical protein Tco_0439163 [Tanacetum coccineum]
MQSRVIKLILGVSIWEGAEEVQSIIHIKTEVFDFMAAAGDLDDIEEVDANCILMANLQQASTSGTQTDKALVYDSDGSTEDVSSVSHHPGGRNVYIRNSFLNFPGGRNVQHPNRMHISHLLGLIKYAGDLSKEMISASTCYFGVTFRLRIKGKCVLTGSEFIQDWMLLRERCDDYLPSLMIGVLNSFSPRGVVWEGAEEVQEHNSYQTVEVFGGQCIHIQCEAILGGRLFASLLSEAGVLLIVNWISFRHGVKQENHMEEPKERPNKPERSNNKNSTKQFDVYNVASTPRQQQVKKDIAEKLYQVLGSYESSIIQEIDKCKKDEIRKNSDIMWFSSCDKRREWKKQYIKNVEKDLGKVDHELPMTSVPRTDVGSFPVTKNVPGYWSAKLEEDFCEFKAHTERRFVSLDMSIRAYRLEKDQRHEEQIRRYVELKNLLFSLIRKQTSLVKSPPQENTKDLMAKILIYEDTTKIIDTEKSGEAAMELELERESHEKGLCDELVGQTYVQKENRFIWDNYQQAVELQVRIWDPGITWLKILKEHLEDKVFLLGEVDTESLVHRIQHDNNKRADEVKLYHEIRNVNDTIDICKEPAECDDDPDPWEIHRERRRNIDKRYKQHQLKIVLSQREKARTIRKGQLIQELDRLRKNIKCMEMSLEKISPLRKKAYKCAYKHGDQKNEVKSSYIEYQSLMKICERTSKQEGEGILMIT